MAAIDTTQRPPAPGASAPAGGRAEAPGEVPSKALANVPAKAGKPLPTGQPGDFDFLAGEWKIHSRRRKGGEQVDEWESFDGEATVHRILAGAGSVEDLRIPSRGFAGLGLRLLDPKQRLWADHWVNAKSGVLTPPPSWGSFVAGVGTWDSDDTDGDQPLIIRGVWDRVTPRSCRWWQALSRDGGASWKENWVMEWRRA